MFKFSSQKENDTDKVKECFSFEYEGKSAKTLKMNIKRIAIFADFMTKVESKDIALFDELPGLFWNDFLSDETKSSFGTVEEFIENADPAVIMGFYGWALGSLVAMKDFLPKSVKAAVEAKN